MPEHGGQKSLRRILFALVGVHLLLFIGFFFFLFESGLPEASFETGRFTRQMEAVDGPFPIGAVLVLLGATTLFAGAVYLLVARLVLRPMERLSREIRSAASTGSIAVEARAETSEFGTLRAAINDMLRHLGSSKASLDVLRHIMNGMDAYLYVTDPETDEILFINDKMREHYGLEGEVVGRICWQALQSGMTRRCDFCPNHKLALEPDAKVVWEEHSTLTGHYYKNTDRLIDWPTGKKVHLQHSVDITGLKTAEAALKRRLEQQELMAAVSQSFISTEDMDAMIRSALRMLGEFTDVARVILGRLDLENDFFAFDHVWYNEKRNIGRFTAPGAPFVKEHLLYRAFVVEQAPYAAYSDISGIDEFFRARETGVRALIAAPIRISDKLWGILSLDEMTFRDWSESDKQLISMIGNIISAAVMRSRTEETLMRMSSIVDSSPQYISYINAEGDFEYLNQGAVNALGYTIEEFMRGGIAILYDSEIYREAKEEIIPRILRDGKAEFELPVRHKNGETRLMRFSAFKTHSGKIGIGSIATDITETRRLERELIAAKEQAEGSSRAKGEFLSRMSHEMRTPLNAIIGMTSIAQSSREPAKMEYCLDKIDGASKHLLGVINDILDMSKIEANKFELSPQEFNLEKMLMRVVNIVTFRVDEKDQTLVINLDPSLPPGIIADEQRLAQVVTNLLANAVKFTPERGTITLSARATAEDDGLYTLRVEVKDTGIGISEEQQARLFGLFEQADGGIARRFGGTGLGLAISKSIVELMGGSIRVESTLGEGAAFIFTVQVRKGEMTRAAEPALGVDWHSLRVLVVDDAADVREYFLNLARAIGFDCETAADGPEAERILAAGADKPFNFVFVDWKMPGMNGVELTRRIKRGKAAGPVVIMISATEWNIIEKEARSAGVARFLAKPLFSSLIVDCITELLGAARPVARESRPTGARTLEGHYVLLAEDNEVNREIAVALLAPTGVTVECAENGRVAFEMFRDSPSRYSLILMDIHMPEVDGYEATRRIRALASPEARSIPIVAMTANVFREDIERCLAAGMTDHIGKPINVEELLKKLNAHARKQ